MQTLPHTGPQTPPSALGPIPSPQAGDFQRLPQQVAGLTPPPGMPSGGMGAAPQQQPTPAQSHLADMHRKVGQLWEMGLASKEDIDWYNATKPQLEKGMYFNPQAGGIENAPGYVQAQAGQTNYAAEQAALSGAALAPITNATARGAAHAQEIGKRGAQVATEQDLKQAGANVELVTILDPKTMRPRQIPRQQFDQFNAMAAQLGQPGLTSDMNPGERKRLELGPVPQATIDPKSGRPGMVPYDQLYGPGPGGAIQQPGQAPAGGAPGGTGLSFNPTDLSQREKNEEILRKDIIQSGNESARKNMDQMRDLSSNADRLLSDIRTIRAINTPTGKLTGAINTGYAVLDGLGLPVAPETKLKIAKGEAFSSVVMNQVLLKQLEQKGVQTTRDTELILNTLPNLEKQGLANEFILDYMEALAVRTRTMHSAYTAALQAAKNGGIVDLEVVESRVRARMAQDDLMQSPGMQKWAGATNAFNPNGRR
jgi:hypothetical protein